MAIQTDVVVVGAGPVGLFQVFELGLQGLSCHVVDTLSAAGGQCTELYPDKPIYDIPAVPICTGNELTELLIKQCSPFDPVFHFDQTVDVINKRAEQDYLVKTSSEIEIECKAIVIAAGTGSFSPVRLRVEGIDQFENKQVYYRVKNPQAHAGKHVVILGGGDSALDWAIELADSVASLTVVNRTEKFRGAESSVNKLFALQDAGKAKILYGAVKAFEAEAGNLKSVQAVMRDEEKSTLSIPLDHLLVFFGLSPKLGPVAEWGLTLDKNLLSVDVSTFETSESGIFAVGDINTYPGKKKLILSGFHEAALAAHEIKHQFEPDKKQHTMYTTTSPVLQKRLGIEKTSS